MPELPEVRTVASFLNNDLKQKTILKIKVNIPKMIKEIDQQTFIKKLEKQTINKVDNYGKFLVFHLSNQIVMLCHLRMEGKYRFEKERNIGFHDDVIFTLEDGFLVFSDTRKFATFHIRDEHSYLSELPLVKLGPEPGKADLNEIFTKIHNRKIAIKTLLLDQTLIRGLGNIYVDEVLFDQKIHPLTPSNLITKAQVKNLLKASQRILDHSTKEKGSSIRTYLAYNSITGNYQNFLKVHTKWKMPCFTCQTKIKKIKVNGRGTYYCPKCQKVNIF